MTLPASGQISIAQIAAEFGGAAPHSLSEYYRGGSAVPNTAANAGIPTSGQMSLSQFYGGSIGTVDIIEPSYSISHSGSAAFVESRISFSNTTSTAGKVFEGDFEGNEVQIGTWRSNPPQEVSTVYQVRWTTISGSPSGGTAVNTWVAIAGVVNWNVTSGFGTVTATGTVEIRRAVDGVVLDSVSVSLSATKT